MELSEIYKKAPKPVICECCGKMKYPHWNPDLGWYWVHH